MCDFSKVEFKPQMSYPAPKPAKLKICDSNKASERQLTLCQPILTNVATRDGMAIVKIDREAVSHLRNIGMKNRKSSSEEKTDFNITVPNFTWASTEAFTLKSENLPKINASVKIFWDGCSGKEAGKFVSVFVEISDLEGKTLEGQFVVTLFLKNLKDENGNSFKKSIKLHPSGPRVERGVRDFVPIEQFDKLLEEESIVSFGILVKQ